MIDNDQMKTKILFTREGKIIIKKIMLTCNKECSCYYDKEISLLAGEEVLRLEMFLNDEVTKLIMQKFGFALRFHF